MYHGELESVEIFYPKVFRDERGWFKENWRESSCKFKFVQENVSCSKKGTLRGLHFQRNKPQGKLVTVLKGAVIDVIVDLRKESDSFLQADYFELSDKNGYQLFVPEGFAHGFLALEDDTIFCYKCTQYYDPTNEFTLRYDEPKFVDLWSKSSFSFAKFDVSEKDRKGMPLKQLEEQELFYS